MVSYFGLKDTIVSIIGAGIRLVREGEYIGARGAREVVVTVSAVEIIVVESAKQGVVAGFAEQAIVSIPSIEAVVPGPGMKQVGVAPPASVSLPSSP